MRIATDSAKANGGRMRLAATIVLLVVGFQSAAYAKAPALSERVFRNLILARIQAYGRGDVETYMHMLSDEFVHVSDRGERRTKNQMRSYVRHGASRASFQVFALSWRLQANLAIVDAAIDESLPFMHVAHRETDLFVWHGERWLYLLHQETPILQPAIAVAVRGDRLTDYVGRYRAVSGTIDDITLRNGVLFDRVEPDDVPAAFVQVGRGAFGLKGDPTLGIFLRNAAGKVTDCLWHLPSGQTIVSHRMR